MARQPIAAWWTAPRGTRLAICTSAPWTLFSFSKFEEQLYAVGAGKDGLVIDVRENGGGTTADHLLTALTQPVHAITVPRGGEPGYPHDRKIYATWNKPIVVLCNQNSFSNAEIFSHAIKTLKRGQLVGVATAGGVISTGAQRIMDVGMIRVPFRGWFVLGSGEDMELNGAVPDHVLWPKPGPDAARRGRAIDEGDRRVASRRARLEAEAEAAAAQGVGAAEERTGEQMRTRRQGDSSWNPCKPPMRAPCSGSRTIMLPG